MPYVLNGANQRRAERVPAVMNAHQKAIGDDDPDLYAMPYSVYDIGNMLTDIMHWCWQNNVSFANSIKCARDNFEQEKEGHA